MASAQSLPPLNAQHLEQIKSFAKFFKAKTREQTKELAHSFEDVKDMRLLEEMYSMSEVSSLMDELKTEVVGSLQNELERYSNQSILYLHQLFLQAEGHRVNLKVDLYSLEDQILLNGIAKLLGEAEQPLPAKDNRPAALSGTADIKMVGRIKELEDELAHEKARFAKQSETVRSLHGEIAELVKTNSRLQADAQRAAADVQNLKRVGGDSVSSVMSDIEKLRADMQREAAAAAEREQSLKKQLVAVTDELAHKVQDTHQFQALKKMVQDKNVVMKDLRAEIALLQQQLGKQ